ncbi:MAG TPA: hypothetical protein VFH31_15980, partial [Pyrinomonadaceae bacterium]|nr:hypothetical protein [Pyrinomonadaceae bacterium]
MIEQHTPCQFVTGAARISRYCCGCPTVLYGVSTVLDSSVPIVLKAVQGDSHHLRVYLNNSRASMLEIA